MKVCCLGNGMEALGTTSVVLMTLNTRLQKIAGGPREADEVW